MTIVEPGQGGASRSGRILVFEEDEIAAVTYASVLRDAGYTVQIAHHVEPALRCLEDRCTEIRLLLADAVVSHGVNGVALARMARARGCAIKVIYLVGDDGVAIEREAIGPILHKPVADAVLLDEVARAMGLPVKFHVRLLDREGRIKAAQSFCASSDTAATAVAGALHEACADVFAGYELWQGGKQLNAGASHCGGRDGNLVWRLDRALQRSLLDLEERLQRNFPRLSESGRLPEMSDRLRQSLAE